MLRRAFLRAAVAAGSILVAVPGLLAATTGKPGNAARRKPGLAVVPSVEQAIQSRDADTVVAFIVENPSLASAAALSDKIEMIQVMKTNMTDTQRAYARTALAGGPAEYEKAALILVKDLEDNPAALSRLVAGIGGEPWVTSRIGAMQNPGLKDLAGRALRN